MSEQGARGQIRRATLSIQMPLFASSASIGYEFVADILSRPVCSQLAYARIAILLVTFPKNRGHNNYATDPKSSLRFQYRPVPEEQLGCKYPFR